MEFVFVRHGSTENLEAHQWQGLSPVPLSSLGVAQAHAAAERIAMDGPTRALYSSPVSRALQTAQIIGAASGMTVRQLESLKERMAPTRLWGVAHTETGEYAAGLRAHRDDPDWGYEDEEKPRAALLRAVEVVEFMLREGEGSGRIVCVSHAIILRLLTAVVLLGRISSAETRLQVHQRLAGPDCCSLSTFSVEGGQVRLAAWNDGSHLRKIR